MAFVIVGRIKCETTRNALAKLGYKPEHKFANEAAILSVLMKAQRKAARAASGVTLDKHRYGTWQHDGCSPALSVQAREINRQHGKEAVRSMVKAPSKRHDNANVGHALAHNHGPVCNNVTETEESLRWKRDRFYDRQRRKLMQPEEKDYFPKTEG